MRNFFVISLLVVFLAGCNTLSGTRSYTSDPRSFLDYAAVNKDVKTIVISHSSLAKKSELETLVTENLNQSYYYLHTNFKTANTANMQKPYRIVFAFNPPIQTTSDQICASPESLKSLPAGENIFIMAVFCENQPLTEVVANVDFKGSAKKANLRDAIKQLAISLVPQEEPMKSFSSE
ncbi:MAG: hypothetical protein HON14_16790 [Rhodospirillaceae bacterium]|jgi:hypothetical protein|nr:hypothetical protein [Rhodospirillaceae bacterium]MBT4940797.1 hypothetical protein [Rhodospirillaceae bacterium]MBT5941206.1 hypothetical protein [Rhodospirillaceae bacterium]MBT7268437.1 hypothetical protein [Rhodospirillaceae bacterium]